MPLNNFHWDVRLVLIRVGYRLGFFDTDAKSILLKR